MSSLNHDRSHQYSNGLLFIAAIFQVAIWSLRPDSDMAFIPALVEERRAGSGFTEPKVGTLPCWCIMMKVTVAPTARKAVATAAKERRRRHFTEDKKDVRDIFFSQDISRSK